MVEGDAEFKQVANTIEGLAETLGERTGIDRAALRRTLFRWRGHAGEMEAQYGDERSPLDPKGYIDTLLAIELNLERAAGHTDDVGGAEVHLQRAARDYPDALVFDDVVRALDCADALGLLYTSEAISAVRTKYSTNAPDRTAHHWGDVGDSINEALSKFYSETGFDQVRTSFEEYRWSTNQAVEDFNAWHSFLLKLISESEVANHVPWFSRLYRLEQ